MSKQPAHRNWNPDFDPEDSYEWDEHPDKQCVKIADAWVVWLKKYGVLKEIGLFNDVHVYWITDQCMQDIHGDAVGIYMHSTYAAPIVGLSAKAHIRAVQDIVGKASGPDFDYELRTGIEMTILHEILHAAEDAEGLDADEDRVEQATREFYALNNLRVIRRFVAGLAP
jgi:hypothetical protein